MHMLYDTRTVHPLDRYDYYQAGAGSEIAPVLVRVRSTGSLLATMSVARIGDFEIEATSWAGEADGVARRTARLIRASDPECYRIFVCVTGNIRIEQADNRACLRARDIGLYDTSQPWRAIHGTGPAPLRLAMLTFPRTLVPIAPDTVRSLVGTVAPRSMPGRDVISEFLVELADTECHQNDPDLVDALRECALGLIRQRLGQPSAFTPQTRKLLYEARVRGIIRRNLADPTLNADRIASAAHISPRYLHKIFRDSGIPPMQLLKRLRLEECHRSLRDPALLTTPIKDLMAAHGYLRPDQFARDFRAQFGVSPRQVRESARHRLTDIR